MSRALALILLVTASLRPLAATELDFEKIATRIHAAKDDNALGATTLVNQISEISVRAAGVPNGPLRRNLELLLCELEDQLAKNTSAESYRVYAFNLQHVGADAAAEICFALTKAPSNAEFDGAVVRALGPALDYRCKVAMAGLLAAHKTPGAVEKLLPLAVTREGLPVQLAVCRALAQLPDKRSVPVLIKYMQECKDKAIGRGLYEACGALRAITQQNFGPDPGSWRGWWEQNDKAFTPPGTSTPEYNFELKTKTDLSYYEIPLIENRIVFVLDISGSMAAGGKPNRLESAVQQMSDLITRLNDKQYFNIVTFSSHVKRWQDTPLVQANDASKKAAKAFLATLAPKGGTETAEAFEDVLQKIVTATSCETVFLVSDGGPNPWSREIKAADQVRLISWINQFLKVRIHTVGIYSKAPTDPPALLQEDVADMKSFLEALAQGNDGTYTEVGK